MTTKPKLITADELLRLPRGEGKRYELVRGALLEKMPTGDSHGDTTSLTHYFLTQYTFESGYGVTRVGEPGYRLERDPDTVRAPDVAWFAPGRLPEGVQGYPEAAPDLVVEVKSPGNSNPEMAAKAQMWLSYGSRIALALDPATVTVAVYRPNAEPLSLSEEDTLDLDDLLPGFSAPVWRLFRRQH